MARTWKIVGGGDKGGLVVREGKSLKSAKADERLSTGALVVEQELADGRLHYKKTTGTGPSEGWISTHLDGKALAELCEAAPLTLGVQPPPIGERKIRILSLHGGGSNANVNKFQTSGLQRLLKKNKIETEWEFLNGTVEWDFDSADKEPLEPITVSIAKGMPFFGWYDTIYDDKSDRNFIEKLMDESVGVTYDGVTEGTDRVMDYIRTNGPFDVICGFSQGTVVASMCAGRFRAEGQTCPWRLSVLFNCLKVRDNRYQDLFAEPHSQPTLQIFGGKDKFYAYGKKYCPGMYVDPVILEHDQAHQFPSAEPRATEIYQEVMRQILWHCGRDPI